jgi:hypothetical protein
MLQVSTAFTFTFLSWATDSYHIPSLRGGFSHTNLFLASCFIVTEPWLGDLLETPVVQDQVYLRPDGDR